MKEFNGYIAELSLKYKKLSYSVTENEKEKENQNVQLLSVRELEIFYICILPLVLNSALISPLNR